jgi:hypothetical protein
VPPSTYDFYYQMSESDGADQTRVGNLPEGYGDPARHGEPFGEMGLVTQKDKTAPFDWATQNGAPIDKQAGNTPGGKRDTRGDGLHGGTTNSTATTSATLVTDIPLAQVIQLSFAYWARILSGLPNATLDASKTPDEVVAGDALFNGLTIPTHKTFNEYDWQFVLL